MLSFVFRLKEVMPNTQDAFQAIRANLEWSFKACGEPTEGDKRNSQDGKRDRYRVVQSCSGGNDDHRKANHHKAHRPVTLQQAFMF
jgi:hypothetical protein